MLKAAEIESQGAAPRLIAIAAPVPGPGDVLVQMKAAALNFADLLKAQGRYQEAEPFPFTPGLEGAGVVISAPGDSGLTPGMRVAVNFPGTLAQQMLAPASACVPIPDAVSDEQAAGFQIAYGTSHLALTLRGDLRAGETLAVLGAAGGVGLTAVQIGAAMGARVIGIARGADRLAAVRAAGAHEVIDSSSTGDLKQALRDLGGVDVVYDPVGDAPGLAAFGALRPGGRHLVIGFAGGRPPALPLNHALVKNIAIHGFYWGGYRKLDSTALRASLTELFAMAADGRLPPLTQETLPLDRVADGFARLRDRASTGKVVITL
ncbi:MAG: NADPH:quinone oxidoreductase family protein [Paracoccus sp. (in: a-proteobacteria)]|uniref:NADPH:quinone oxidoreductase family protein n=1 Tax=Paracoccus sp. TaxID=267 RepID=UPI0026E01215|nr:NADPH:quinone oxidoreductase family protein [Paracoccus sp. (in: a-proteobacteria)]MDO5613068.1 NADPH:quinone oxidoreductase family protein [Paracoccus sp. (in: a-proteobacteria)]